MRRIIRLIPIFCIVQICHSRMSGKDLSEKLVFETVSPTAYTTQEVGPQVIDDFEQHDSSGPTIMPEDAIDEVSGYTKSNSPSATSTPHELTPRGSMRATLKRIGAKVEPEADDEASLREALRLALLDSERVKMPLLRGVLFERGGTCKGCIERTEYVEAIFSSLHKPLVGRHGLPLFLYDAPLFPHTLMGLNLYEPRYKLLCRRALKVERLFGFVTGEVGVLARMVTVDFVNEDAIGGNCEMRIVGTRRFKLVKHWAEQCAGCPEPLHYADVTYLPGTDDAESDDSWPHLVKKSLKLHHQITSTEVQRQLEAQLGAMPQTKSASPTALEHGYAISMWLAGACSALSPACRAEATQLLTTTSTRDRLERIIKAYRSMQAQEASRGQRAEFGARRPNV